MKVLKLLCKLLWPPVVVGTFVVAIDFASTMFGGEGVFLVFGVFVFAWGGYAIADMERWFE